MFSIEPRQNQTPEDPSTQANGLVDPIDCLLELEKRQAAEHCNPERILAINRVIDEVLQELAQTKIPVHTESQIPLLRVILNYLAKEQDEKLEAIVTQAKEAHTNFLQHGDIDSDHLRVSSRRTEFLLAVHDGLIHKAKDYKELGQRENAQLCVDALKHFLRLDGAAWALYCSVAEDLP